MKEAIIKEIRRDDNKTKDGNDAAFQTIVSATLEDQEMAESKILKLTEFVTAMSWRA